MTQDMFNKIVNINTKIADTHAKECELYRYKLSLQASLAQLSAKCDHVLPNGDSAYVTSESDTDVVCDICKLPV